MDKSLSLVFLVVYFIHNVNALNCYSCQGMNNSTCLNLSYYKNSSDISKCSVHSRFLESQLRQIYGAKYTEPAARGADSIKCVHYQKFYTFTNTTEVFRGCLQTQYVKDFCNGQITNQHYFQYDLTKCNVCGDDLCNAGLRHRSVPVHTIIFVAIATVVNKFC